MVVTRQLLVGVILGFPLLIGGWAAVAILQRMHHRAEVSNATTVQRVPISLATTATSNLGSKGKNEKSENNNVHSKVKLAAMSQEVSDVLTTPSPPPSMSLLSVTPSDDPIADLDFNRWEPIDPLEGADGLGGPVTLKSLREPKMPVAARAERLQQKRSGDTFAMLPPHWQQRVRHLLPDQKPVGKAAWVRFPVPNSQARSEVAMLLTDTGETEALLPVTSDWIRQRVDQWLQSRPLPSAGTYDLYVLAFEPMSS